MAGNTQFHESLEDDEDDREAVQRLERDGPGHFRGKLAYRLPGAAACVIDAPQDMLEILRSFDAIGIRPDAPLDVVPGAPADAVEFGLMAGHVTVTNAGGGPANPIEQARHTTVESEATAKPQTA